MSAINLNAQKKFVEGILIYNVTIEPPVNQEGIEQIHGTYTIMVKGGNIRKDLVMENGFHNTTLLTNKKMYILRDMGKKKLAIELDIEQMNKQYEAYRNFSLKKKKNTKTIAGIEAREGTITYKSGNTVDIYFTEEWEPYPELFDKFPAIAVLPLTYEYRNDDGTVMYFQLEKIEQRPLENANFHIGNDCKIMTHDEYEKMNR